MTTFNLPRLSVYVTPENTGSGIVNVDQEQMVQNGRGMFMATDSFIEEERMWTLS